MNLVDYHNAAIRTAKWFPSLQENLEHTALGLTTEIGEFATIVKRVSVYGKPMTPEMREHALEELGDVYWYLPLACQAMGTTLDAVVAANAGDFDEMPELSLKHSCITLAGVGGTVAAYSAALSVQGQIDEISKLRPIIALIVMCLNQCCRTLGADPAEVRAANIAKLRLRFPAAYTDEAAEARADKGGLDARNS